MSSNSSASGATPPAVQLAYPGEYLSDAAWRWSAKAGHRGSQRHSEADDAWTDKAGGACMWHAELPAPPTEATECKLCGGPLYLLTQLYLPSSTAAAAAGRLPAHLYVLACNKVACALSGKEGCWRALKLVVNDAEEGAALNPALQGRVAAAPSHAIAAEAAAAPAPAPAQAALSPPPKAAASASATAASTSSKKAAPSSSSSSSSATAPAAAAPKPAPAAPAKAESDEDEWGAKAAWSDDEDSSATKKTKGKGKAAVDDDDDDDAVLTALLAKQSLQQEANRAAKAAAAEKADKAAAARAAKAARKEEMRAQATQELMEAALEARRKAEADGTASASAAAAAAASSSVAAPTAAAPAASQPPPTCFRPFYLAWCPEPAPSAPEHSREMRLLREYEARMAEEGEESELAALRGAQNGGAPGELSATGLSTDEEEEEDAIERRDDDTQAFFDRVDRLRDQCVRYYEPQPAAATAAGSSVVPAAVTQGVYSTRAELAFRDGVARNPALRCAHCRSVRQLEVQLMPKLLWEMHVDSVDPKDPGMDWLTLDVYTCPLGCRTNEYVDEHVHVQPPL